MRVARIVRRLAVGGSLLVLAGCTSPPPPPSILTAPLAVGVGDRAPGFSLGDTNPAGFDIDLMNAIGARLHTPVANTPLTSTDRAGKLKSGTATIVIATYSITTQRNQDGIDFAGPYMITPPGAACPRERHTHHRQGQPGREKRLHRQHDHQCRGADPRREHGDPRTQHPRVRRPA